MFNIKSTIPLFPDLSVETWQHFARPSCNQVFQHFGAMAIDQGEFERESRRAKFDEGLWLGRLLLSGINCLSRSSRVSTGLSCLQFLLLRSNNSKQNRAFLSTVLVPITLSLQNEISHSPARNTYRSIDPRSPFHNMLYFTSP